MKVMGLALGGCIKGPPVAFGLTEDTGGHITYALGAAMALAEREDVERVELVTRLIDAPDLGLPYSVPVEIVRPGFIIRRLDTGNRAYLSKEANAADRPAFVRALIEHFADPHNRPDIIHAHFADAAEVAAAVRDRYGIPFIYTAHSLGIDKRSTGAVGLEERIALEARAIAAADAIIASSRDEAERQLMLYPSASPARIHQVSPGATLAGEIGVGSDDARALLAPFLRDPDKPMLLAVARPVRKKNLAGLIDMYAADSALRMRANLVILAGLRDAPDSGESEQCEVVGSLLDRMDRHDLYGQLALPKRHSRRQVSSLYTLAREGGGLFVNPAFTEPYGLTLTEAAAHGLPVVATDQGGPRDIVAALGHGIVADPSDPEAFARAIHELLNDTARWHALSETGSHRAKSLGWASYAQCFVDIARSLQHRRPVDTPRGEATDFLLCDIDNTLTGCRDGAGKLRRTLEARRSLGFGVATGRSLQEARRLLREWGYPDPSLIISSVGSEIYWSRRGRTRQDDRYAEHIDHVWQPDDIRAAMRGIAGLIEQPPVEQRRFKLSYFADAADAANRARERLAQLGLSARVIYSHGRLLDILPERAGKGAAMRWAADAMQIGLDRFHAAGDSGNDLDMLEACPNAIIVANHEPVLASLRSSQGAYFARAAFAGGVAEALDLRLEGMRA
ncbi:hypothetical protein DMC47_07220 [Nostoc sp. 3335mG]|nr:hypothetical protein DMC47_07220 [Nostoc sp. 3335mG]